MAPGERVERKKKPHWNLLSFHPAFIDCLIYAKHNANPKKCKRYHLSLQEAHSYEPKPAFHLCTIFWFSHSFIQQIYLESDCVWHATTCTRNIKLNKTKMPVLLEFTFNWWEMGHDLPLVPMLSTSMWFPLLVKPRDILASFFRQLLLSI